ncbi:hypothetical protein [Cohnella soli]|uniref:Uncharacterized protein n=1 Tax=Cohnella soli TaxID=425005 RepID=A0ABW0HTL4_9BACL
MSTIFKVSSPPHAPERLIAKMRRIVEDVVVFKKFHFDFELNDRTTLDHKPGVYAWYVYECGTHLMPLNDLRAVQEFQRDWIKGLASIEGKKADDDRLYVLNGRTGDIQRVMEFKKEPNLMERLLHTAI